MKRKIMSIVLILAVAGSGAFVFMGSASAGEADGTTYASVTELHGESQNGQVDGITVSSTGYVEWEGVSDADSVRVTLEAKNGSDWDEFATETYEDVPSASEGDYSYDEVSGEIIENTSLKAQAFSSDEDGEMRKQYVPIRVTVEVVNGDGEVACEFSEVHKVKTEVTNLLEPELTDTNTDINGSIDMNNSGAGDCETCS